MRLCWKWLLCLGFAAGFVGSSSAADQVKVEPQDQALLVKVGGQEFTTFHYAPGQPKPYFSPVRAADGAIITRPLNDPEDKDHPHHKGIWNAIDEVNDLRFWAEKAKIVSKDVQWSQVGDAVQLTLKNDWMGPEHPALHETALVTIYPNRLMVYHMTFTKPANEKTVTFGDTKEGLFGIRVATSMREKVGGTISNANGEQTAKNCWGKPSKWVDYSGKVGDKTYGVTMMDSPKNFRPSRYHCRDYGLFSVSPFGEGAYQNDASKAKLVVLDEATPKLELTYGLYVHSGDAEEGQVAKVYEHFLALTATTSSPIVASSERTSHTAIENSNGIVSPGCQCVSVPVQQCQPVYQCRPNRRLFRRLR